jgi:uncharacterized protein YdaU (DUF1376 family)
LSEFYKMEPLRWDRGTDNLTLEQEAAYLRICNAIYAADQAIAENYRTLAGMWRCNERKAKRLLAELIDAGKVYVEAGWIKNDKAISDVEIRRELRVKRQLAGHSGGIESGKVRAKAAENKGKAEANGSTRKEVEESTVAKATGGDAAPSYEAVLFRQGLDYLKANGVSDKNGRSIIGRWRKQSGDYEVYVALKRAKDESVSEPVAYVTAALKPKPDVADQKLAAWGIGDAQPVRLEPRPRDTDAEASAGAPDLPRVQREPEGFEPEGPMSFGDANGGWDRGALPSLRLVCGGAL